MQTRPNTSSMFYNCSMKPHVLQKKACSQDAISCTQRISNLIHYFVNYLFGFSIVVQKNRMIQVASRVLAVRYRGHGNDVRSIVKILFNARS